MQLHITASISNHQRLIKINKIEHKTDATTI